MLGFVLKIRILIIINISFLLSSVPPRSVTTTKPKLGKSEIFLCATRAKMSGKLKNEKSAIYWRRCFDPSLPNNHSSSCCLCVYIYIYKQVWNTMMFVLLLLSALLPCLVLGAKTTWRDPFVQAAPLVVAARCRDGGVCLVAAHSPEEEDPLLYYDGEGDEKMDDAGSRFLDLPRRYGGPFRIQAIGFGCVMAPIGWRADCHELVDASIELSSEEIKKFGPGDMHGVYLSDALSIYLAQCQSSESVSTIME